MSTKFKGKKSWMWSYRDFHKCVQQFAPHSGKIKRGWIVEAPCVSNSKKCAEIYPSPQLQPMENISFCNDLSNFKSACF